jgi:hypothetical protein
MSIEVTCPQQCEYEGDGLRRRRDEDESVGSVLPWILGGVGALVTAIILVVLAMGLCSSVTEANYEKINERMTEEEVKAILG